VLAPPTDLEQDELVRTLAYWGWRAPALTYLPVGFGSHHWRAEDGDVRRAFVTVDDLSAGFRASDELGRAFEALGRAYAAAAALRDDAGLEFVVGPIHDAEGRLIRGLGERYAVSVAPFVDGRSSEYGDWERAADRRRIGLLVGRLHAGGERIDPGLARRDDLRIQSRSALTDALAALDTPWTAGPLAEPARLLLAKRAQELEVALQEYDALAASVRETSDSWVLTHGEPHRGNVIVGEDGAFHLVDWDTTLVAPRERDLQIVLDEKLTGWDEYASIVGDVPLDPEALDLYRRRWELADIADFVRLFRRAHEEDANTVAAFGHLRSYLDR
jgi:spectinomycin phosphotransferase